MKRIMHYTVTISEEFKVDINWACSFPVPVGKHQIQYTNLSIIFEHVSKDPLIDSDKALDIWIKKNHPNMDYRIYYWTLEPI